MQSVGVQVKNPLK